VKEVFNVILQCDRLTNASKGIIQYLEEIENSRPTKLRIDDPNGISLASETD